MKVDTGLGDAPIESNYRAQMNAVAKMLDQVFNGDAIGPDRKIGFVLMIFPYGGEGGRANYISNGADRKDIARLFREQAKRFDGGPE